MPDFRLPYFYNAALAGLLAVFVLRRLDWMLRVPNPDPLLYIQVFLTVAPSLAAGAYFFREFQDKNDLRARECLFILIVVQFVTSFLPSLLR